MSFMLPHTIKPENLRFFKITQVAYIIGFVGHTLSAIRFQLIGIPEMFWFNCLYSIPAFTFSFFMNRRGHHNIAFAFAFFELLVHQSLGIYFIGWAAGFQYWLIYLIGLSFFNAHWNRKVRFLCFSIVFSAFIILYMFFKTSTAYTFSEAEYDVMYLGSSFGALLLVALLINYYVQTATQAEEKLKSANHELSKQKIQISQTLEERNQAFKRLDHELSEAADYVKNILPDPLTTDSVRVDWRFIPSASLGGDAFGYHWLDKNHFSFYLIDVSGHGVRPALLSISVINALRSESLPDTDFYKPETVMSSLNKAFPSDKNNAMFFTAWYGVYNIENRILNFASAGHPPGLLLSQDQNLNIETLRTPNLIIGALEDAEFESQQIQISENSRLYIFSDGIYEIKKVDGKMWRFGEFTDFISSLEQKNQLNFNNLIEQTRIIGNCESFQDDYTIMEIRFI